MDTFSWLRGNSKLVTESLPVPVDVLATGAPAPPVPLDELRALVEPDLAIDSVEVPRDPQEGVVVLRGRLLKPSHAVFTPWLTKLNALGYTPVLRAASDQLAGASEDEVILRILPGVMRRGKSRVWINVVLFALTVVSTLFVGSLYSDLSVDLGSPWEIFLPQNLIKGLPFAAALLGILGAHEFGHYFAARYHKVSVTLPYFIPMPLGFGTLGAFIQMKEPVPDRRKLFDIGVAGPLAGLCLAVPLLIYGLATSPVLVPPPMAGAVVEGNSILYFTAKLMILGKVLPNPLTHEDVMMNQITFAAWIGLLVTAINLLPVGQLDGGHAVFAMFGRKARTVNWFVFGAMLVFAIAGLPWIQEYLPALRLIGYSGWFLWLGLIFFLIGVEHPPALDDVTQLDRRRWWVGILVIAIFIVTFVPVPMGGM